MQSISKPISTVQTSQSNSSRAHLPSITKRNSLEPTDGELVEGTVNFSNSAKFIHQLDNPSVSEFNQIETARRLRNSDDLDILSSPSSTI